MVSALQAAARTGIIEGASIQPLGGESEHFAGRIVFRMRVEPDDLDGGFIAECVDLPGCMAQGETEAEALDNLADALFGVLEARMESNLQEGKFVFDSAVAEVSRGPHVVRTVEVAV